MGFRYDQEWIADNGFAASHSLPLATDEFTPEDGVAHRFFANLLPEEGVRDHVVRYLRLPNTDFDLLRAIEHIDDHLAFEVGGENGPHAMAPTHGDTLAEECDIRPQLVHNLIVETQTAIQEKIGSVREAFEENNGPYPALQRIEKVISKQCQRGT